MPDMWDPAGVPFETMYLEKVMNYDTVAIKKP